jgi:hypothetical protein
MKQVLAAILFTLLITLLRLGAAQGQTYSLKTQDSLVHALANRHLAINKARRSMPGYRIQIYFGSDRTRANDIKTDFLQLFPHTGTYLVYQQPNFKIRVGDYKTRLEAMKFLKEIQPLFSGAFIVKDDVKLPE